MKKPITIGVIAVIFIFSIGIKTRFGVGINPETNMIYVGGEYVNILSVINADTKQVVSEIPLKDPYDIAVNPTNNMIYVTSDRSNSVYVIDGKTNEIVTSFEVLVPCGIAVNPATGMVYVTSESEDIVHVFDGNKNEIVTIINFEDNLEGLNLKENGLNPICKVTWRLLNPFNSSLVNLPKPDIRIIYLSLDKFVKFLDSDNDHVKLDSITGL